MNETYALVNEDGVVENVIALAADSFYAPCDGLELVHDKEKKSQPGMHFDGVNFFWVPWAQSVLNVMYTEDGKISCDVLRKGDKDYINFVTGMYESESDRRQLYEELISGIWGSICDFIPSPDVILQEIRVKYDEVNAWRDAQEAGNIYFTVNGHRWDASKASQSRLAPVVAVASAGGLPAGFFWTDADNNDVPMDAAGLKALELSMQGAMVMRGFQIHERQRQMKEEISRLTSLDAIRHYTIGWPDAS
ncbi:TPA: DUF4376 domain-containing protein [Citrobacter amalonaticus]